MSDIESRGGDREKVYVAETELAAGALRFPEVLMQAVTLIAPARRSA
jgi:hypothetical protein